MIGKPFRPPLLQRKPHPLQADSTDNGPSTKKRRISEDEEGTSNASKKSLSQLPRVMSAPRKPLLVVKNSAAAATAFGTSHPGVEEYYSVLWRKFTAKKHKTWDGDGVLSVSGGYANLQDESGKELGRTACKTPLLPGSQISVGGKEVEVDSVMTKEDYLRGRQFLGTTKMSTVQPPVDTPRSSMKTQRKETKLEVQREKAPSFVAAAKSEASTAQFRNPLLSTTILPKSESRIPVPRHDPNQEGALVMKRPAQAPRGKQIVDVVVDPFLSRHLREHQRLGVRFLYECVMGMRSYGGEGAILADDMGLGKTLQTIALLWTLLKQNPVYEEAPVIKKALIVCPVSLINNWRKEFKKWLGVERIGVFVADEKRNRLTDFTMGKSYNIMIVGYEKLKKFQDDLKKGAGIDIVIMDEGHRLKTAQNKSMMAIKSLNTERRIVLTGTPFQNNLGEYYTLVDLVNPGSLQKYTTFKRQFEGPIVKGRQPEATTKDKEKGEARFQELTSLTDMFILRRTADILAKYLPPKTEYVLFCRPTTVQASVYRSVLSSPVFGAVLRSSEASLQLINILKKVCNSPNLLSNRIDEDKENSNQTIKTLLADIPPMLLKSPGASGKLQVLDSLLHHLRTTTQEKVVLVSNYTSTLDILGNLLSSLSYKWLRLDGSTPPNKRQDLVDKFNRTDAANCFAFLLSAKSGGVGLNLIGASRLVLFDVDWNPGTDLQAMARIHRDGQKRPCKIYRLLTQGALDEKIYQRQLTKQGLADSVIDNKANASSFTTDELRNLFTLDESGRCQTHELLACPCEGRGVPVMDAEAPDSLDSNVSTDDEDELPSFPNLIKASQYDAEAQERQAKERRNQASKKQGKPSMMGLMQYLHLDTSRLASTPGDEERSAGDEPEAAVDDDVLLDVLKEEGNRVAFVFAKTSASVLD
ncbi:hypothetical protein LTR04_002121 [Oleoguttula sp. CCFEE 6159]|nr:hypothetical protein LTR04_002121 [Oleoguttula sp. CCFEE 6159]